MQYHKFDCPVIVIGRRRVDDKNCSRKNWRLLSWSAFLWRLPTFNQTGWRSRSASFDAIKPLGLSSTLGLLCCSTRPFGQVAPPIWPEKKYAEADNSLLPPMWCFLWDLPHSCTYLHVYYLIRKKKMFNDVPYFIIRKLNFQVIQRFTHMFISHQSGARGLKRFIKRKVWKRF